MTALPDTFPSGGKSLPLDVFMPAAPGEVPAVLILHGSFGMLPLYRADILSFAEALVEIGIGAAIPHYLDSTGDGPALPMDPGSLARVIDANHLLWRQACLDALTAMAGDVRFDAARLGVLGFSLGGYLALSLAMDPPAAAPVRGVADFFGPTDKLDTNWSRLPPALIFHGDEDPLVNPAESARVVSELKLEGRKEGTDFFYKVYPGEGHGFQGAALTDSRDRTVEFFKALFQDSP